MFKFALFIAVALVAVQGFQARSVDEEYQVRGIIDVINNIIQKIKDIVSGIGSAVGDLIKELANKIKDIIERIPEIISEIKKKIEDLIAEAGALGKKCVDAHEQDIDDIVNTARNGMEACVNEAQSKVEAVKDQVKVLVDKVNALQQNVADSVAKCVKDANLNPIKLYNCLSGLVKPILGQISEIEEEVANTIGVARDTVVEASIGLAKCVAKVEVDVANKQKALFEALKECIAAGIN